MTNSGNNIIKNSWLATTGNGSHNEIPDPTPGQKTWVAILLGFLFFIISCPIIDKILRKDFKITLIDIVISLVKTFIFIIIIRLIMW